MIMTLQDAAEWARKLQASGKTLAVTALCAGLVLGGTGCTGNERDYENNPAGTMPQLEDSAYRDKTACPYCAPQPRRAGIDELNSKNNR